MDAARQPNPSRLKRHARYLDPDVVYHVTSKALRGEFFLHPSPATNEVILGVLGRAQVVWPNVDLFAYVFMSNHFHLMLKGKPKDLPAFIGFIKREISRRLGAQFQSTGPMWQRRYEATALPTAASQLKCLKYILGHGVKEGLVESPLDWPGVHCAQQMLDGKAQSAKWLNATRFGKALFLAKSRGKKMPLAKDFEEKVKVRLTPLSPWRTLGPNKLVALFKALVGDLVDRAAEKRSLSGSQVAGKKAIAQTSPTTKKPPPKLPWYERRRRQVVAWASPRDPAVQAYIRNYWDYQQARQMAA